MDVNILKPYIELYEKLGERIKMIRDANEHPEIFRKNKEHIKHLFVEAEHLCRNMVVLLDALEKAESQSHHLKMHT